MDSVVNIVVGILTVLPILQGVFFPRISKALGYRRLWRIRQPHLDWMLSSDQKEAGMVIYTDHILFMCYGEEPVNRDDIDRHPSIMYDDMVAVLTVETDDPRKILPNLKRHEQGLAIEAQWNPHEV